MPAGNAYPSRHLVPSLLGLFPNLSCLLSTFHLEFLDFAFVKLLLCLYFYSYIVSICLGVRICFQIAADGGVVNLLACRARGPEIESGSCHYGLRDLVILAYVKEKRVPMLMV